MFCSIVLANVCGSESTVACIQLLCLMTSAINRAIRVIGFFLRLNLFSVRVSGYPLKIPTEKVILESFVENWQDCNQNQFQFQAHRKEI